MVIYHLIRAGDWEAAQAAGGVAPAAEGFVHLSTAEQLAGTVDRFYAGVADLLVLAVDPDRLAGLRWEPAPDGRGVFPHLYAPLMISDVVSVARWQPPA